jgi:WD40 repeat protein
VFQTSSFQQVLNFSSSESEVNSIDFTVDLNLLISGHSDGIINFWSPVQNKHIDSIQAHSDIVWAIRITRNEESFVTCSEDNSVKIWKVIRRELIFEFKGHSEAVNCLCMSHSNVFIVSGSDDRTLKIWNISKKNCESSLMGH